MADNTEPPTPPEKRTYLAGIVSALKQLGKALTGGYWGGI